MHVAGYVCKRMVAVCMAGEAEFAPSIEPEQACDTILIQNAAMAKHSAMWPVHTS